MWCELLKGAKQWLSLTYKLTTWKLNTIGHADAWVDRSWIWPHTARVLEHGAVGYT